MKDAYSQPQMTRPGCQHQLGCRCEPPYHLRASTLSERRKERRQSAPTSAELSYREMLAKLADASIPHTLKQQIAKLLSQS